MDPHQFKVYLTQALTPGSPLYRSNRQQELVASSRGVVLAVWAACEVALCLRQRYGNRLISCGVPTILSLVGRYQIVLEISLGNSRETLNAHLAHSNLGENLQIDDSAQTTIWQARGVITERQGSFRAYTPAMI